MNQVQEIIANYKSADEELRLSMFLTYRDLRPQFMEIDMAGLKSQVNAVSQHTGDLDGNSRPSRLALNCWGWLKQCWSLR